MEIKPTYLVAMTLGAGLPSWAIPPRTLEARTGFTHTAKIASWDEDRSYVNTQNQIFLLSALKEIEKDCAEPGWDGDGAISINSRVLENSKQVIRQLPFTIAMPEISPQSNGKIAFEWFRGPYRQLLLSVGEHSDVAYAALLGSRRISGWVQLSLLNDLIEEMRVEHKLIPSSGK
jgi:hypothetical protein